MPRKSNKTPLFTHKHYNVIAKLMGEATDGEAFCVDLCKYFVQDNPKFDMERFRKAGVAANRKKHADKA